MAFKQDEDFLRYLTMGAAGTRRAAEHMASIGHRVVELERYSTANKLWSTKIKRLRLPDLMCLRCGRRVEAKAKSKLEIKLSHSTTVGREWDAGLRDADVVAFIPCTMTGLDQVTTGSPEYFTVEELRRTIGLARLGPPKAASEGAERDYTWPSIVPTQSGTVADVTPERVTVVLARGRRQSYPKRWPAWTVNVPVGGTFTGGQRFLAGPVRLAIDVACVGDSWDPALDLRAREAIDRYAAVKAVGVLGRRDTTQELVDLATADADDARVRLEAMGALGRLGEAEWIERLQGAARDALLDAGFALEAVFILSEIATTDACAALASLAHDRTLGSDTRSASTWGLGVAGAKRPEPLMALIGDPDDAVALHAIAAMPTDLPDACFGDLADAVRREERLAWSALEVLLRQGERGISVLVDIAVAGGPGAPRAVVGLGRAPRAVVLRLAADRLSEALRQLLEPLWADSETNWIHSGNTPYELALLSRQTLHGPA